MGKKKDDKEELAADFFGDDDWMDDDEDDEDDESEEEDHLPVAPSAPSTQEEPRPDSVVPLDALGDKLEEPNPLSNAPTLHFSSVPTIPPMDQQETDVPLATEDVPTATAPPPVAPPPELPEAAKRPGGTLDLLGSNPPSADVSPESDDPPESGPSADEEQSGDEDSEEVDPATEAPEFFGDDLTAAEEPLVRTHDPAPARVEVPVLESETPTVIPPKPELEKWEPQGDEAGWLEVVETLVAEAALDEGDKGELLHAAARVRLGRLNDHAGADELLVQATSAGLSNLPLLLDRIRALKKTGRESEAVPVCVLAAEISEPDLAAELLLDAVDLTRDVDPDRAIELARTATERAPEDYAAWSALRDLLGQTGASIDERLLVLNRLGALSSGWGAAEAQLEAAGALLGEERAADAAKALQVAREAAPGHGTVFTVLAQTLSSLGDYGALAALYRSEAQRDEEWAGWWLYQAGRALHRAGDASGADALFVQAVEGGLPAAERTRQAAAISSEEWSSLAGSLEAEAKRLEGVAAAFSWYRLGDVRERQLGDADGALAAYREAVAADPEAGPAADGVARLLSASNDTEGLRALWADRVAAAEGPATSPMHFRMAEVCESAGDQEGAESHYQQALDASPGAGVRYAATEGLARVLHRGGRWGELADHWASRAKGLEDAGIRANLLYRASVVGERSVVGDREAADRLLEVVALDPAHAGALFELSMRLEALGDWTTLARALDDAGDAMDDPVQRCVFKYRAARVRIERSVEPDRVVAGLRGAVDAEGSFQPAIWALRDATSKDADAQLSLYRTQAEAGQSPSEAIWAGFAASLRAPDGGREDTRSLFERAPSHPGVLAAEELSALLAGDQAAVAAVWTTALAEDASDLSAVLALASLQQEIGNTAAAQDQLLRVSESEQAQRPLRAAARVAEGLGAFDLAAGLLEQLPGVEDRLQRARLVGRRKGDMSAALPIYQALLDDEAAGADGAFGAAICAAQLGEVDLLAKAHEAVMSSGASDPARASSARWAAILHERADRLEEALACWRQDLALRPTSMLAFEGCERVLRRVGDAQGVASLYQGSADIAAHANALLAVGDAAGAAEMLGAAVDSASPALPVQLYLEKALESVEDWQGLYDRLSKRREGMRDEAQRGRVDARRRWVLAEKLAETDAAWDLYRSLHDENPDDREVTEALARIAGARGDTGMAVRYLKELAESSSEAADAARYQRRVGEVYERNDDSASARQAYLDALDHDNHDREALDGLRRLAEADEDWPALIQVHQREVGIAAPGRALELKRSIAEVTEDKLGDKAVAMDAWRAVLELDDDDPHAMTRMMALANDLGEWGTYVEVGERLSQRVRGRERTELLRKVGVACQEQLERDDAIRFYEQAVTSDTPDLEAARRLEDLYRARGDWGATIRALVVQADVLDDPAEKVEPLVRAATLELEVRHDRQSAAEFYRRVLETAPDHGDAMRFMAEHLYQSGQFEQAREIAERLEPGVEDDQDLDDFDTRMELSTFYYSLGEMLRTDNDGEGALKRYARALELNPSHQGALGAVGPLYTEREQWKKAEQVYRQLLQLTGGQGDGERIAGIYTSLGMVEYALGLNDKAYKRFNKALELHSTQVGALKGMALVLEGRKDWNNLLNVFNNIIYHASVPSDVVAAYMTKGRILDQHMERPDKAAQHYQASLSIDARHPEALIRMAELALRREAWDEAQVYGEKALALPGDLLGEHGALGRVILAAALKGAGAEGFEKHLEHAKEADADLVAAFDPDPLLDPNKLRDVVRLRFP